MLKALTVKQAAELFLKFFQDTHREGSDPMDSMYAKYGLLYIEPATPATSEPLIDAATRKMAAAFRNSNHPPVATAGHHVCICGAASTAHDYILPDGFITNSLCVHYVALHRDAISPEELEKILGLDDGEVEPAEHELHWTRK